MYTKINDSKGLLILLILMLGIFSANAQNVDYYISPEIADGAGMYNVKTDFGAVGDGITDDTQALLNAFRGDSVAYYTGENEGGYRSIYIPPGKYLVTKPLPIGDKKKVVYGSGRDSTIIILKANSPAFQDAQNPVKFIDALAKQYQAQNFWIFIRHLTIKIEEGNPGVTALSFHTNNTGGVYDVDIISDSPAKEGYCGLLLTSWPGPGIIKNVSIDGFDYGIKVTDDQYSMTFEHVKILNSRNTAFHNTANTCSVRKLIIENAPKGIVTSGSQSMMAIIDCEISGSGVSAIECTSDALAIVKNLKTSGFTYAATSSTDTVTGTFTEEWLTHEAKSAFPSVKHSLDLPVMETPELAYETSPEKYKVITAADGDFSTAVQAAIDAGYETIYIASRWAKNNLGAFGNFSETIVLRNNVKRVMGMGNAVLHPNIIGGPVFLVEDGNADTVFIQNIYWDYGVSYTYAVEQASTRTVVFQNGSGSYRNTVDNSNVFIEDIVGAPIEVTNANAWIRDLNTESYDVIHVTSDNSNVWTLGHKTEKDQVIYKTINGGKTELLGALLYKNNEHTAHPMFVVENADATFAYREKGIPYIRNLEEVRNDSTRYFVQSKTYGGRMALLSAWAGNVPDEPSELNIINETNTMLEIQWTDNSSNENGFIIQRKNSSGDFETIATADANLISYADTALMPGTSYTYRILAFNEDGNSLTLYTPEVKGTTSNVNTSSGVNSEKSVVIYPNPTGDVLNIEFATNGFADLLNIYDINGSLILQKNGFAHLGKLELDVSSLSKGIYLVEISSKKNRYSERIIIK